MSYKITLNFQGGRQNHIGNPLNRLDDRECATREEACEAIYAALDNVISGDGGCEIVQQPDPTLGMVYSCDREGNNAEPLDIKAEPYPRSEALSVELGDPCITLRETTGEDGLDWKVDFVAVNADGEIVGYYQWREDEHWLDRYCSACHDYIIREGRATEDGVTATVEQVVFTFREVIENNAGDAVEFTENDGYLNNNLTVRATCWTDDESLLDSLATFDVTADWEITASSPVSGNTIYFLRRQIEDKIGGEWRYDSENRQFVQVEEEES